MKKLLLGALALTAVAAAQARTLSPEEALQRALSGASSQAKAVALTAPELVAEGLAREFVSHVQSMRKEADFEVTQRIVVTAEVDADVQAALTTHADYVKNETLATELNFGACPDSPALPDVDLNGHAAKIRVAKA